jgi:Mu transposase, C-terminal domain
VLDQTVPTFLGSIRRGFEWLGGVPSRLKPDNLRSAVLVNHLGERFYQEDFFRFCRHYGTVPDAARPYTPTDKGRTEREIRYVKESCFGGRGITDFEEAKAHLERWHSEVAMVRVHGTTRRRPLDLFEEERASLGLLVDTPYEITTFGHYKVRKDCHVHVLGNYYSAPHRYVARKVTVQIGEETVRIHMDGECVARHARSFGKGETITDPSHYPVEKRIGTQEIHRRRLEGLRSAGRWTGEYLARLKEGRWVFGDQVARLARLLESYGPKALERACRRAVYFGALDGAARIERILEKGLEDQPLPDTLIPMPLGTGYGRPLDEYDALLAGRTPA